MGLLDLNDVLPVHCILIAATFRAASSLDIALVFWRNSMALLSCSIRTIE
jgi:hypothetical protein